MNLFKKITAVTTTSILLVGCASKVRTNGYRNGIITHRTSYGGIELQHALDYKNNRTVLLLTDVVDETEVMYRVTVDMLNRRGSISSRCGNFFKTQWSYPTLPLWASTIGPVQYKRNDTGFGVTYHNKTKSTWWDINITEQQTTVKVYTRASVYGDSSTLSYGITYDNDTQYSGFRETKHDTTKNYNGIKWFE